MPYDRAVVWLDHRRALIIQFDVDSSKTIEVLHHSGESLPQHGRGSGGPGRALEDQHYYHSIAEALQGSNEILVVGPADAKLELIKHLYRHSRDLAEHLVGVETVEQPGEVLQYAREYLAGTQHAPGAPVSQSQRP